MPLGFFVVVAFALAVVLATLVVFFADGFSIDGLPDIIERLLAAGR